MWDLVCPGSGRLCRHGVRRGGARLLRGAADGGRTWAAYPLPGSTGVGADVVGMDCLSSSFCYALGGTSAATVWWSSTPGQGGWRAKVFPGNIGIDTMTCRSPGVCVAVTTVGGEVETSTGTAWSTADIGGGGWSAQPLDLAYRVFGVECPSMSTCVAWGQGATSPGDFQVDPTLWTTSAAFGGAWARVLPIATGSGYSYNIKSVECPTTSLCVANGVSWWTSGATSQFYSCYWVTTAPASPVGDGWEWHQGEGSPFNEARSAACHPRSACRGTEPGPWVRLPTRPTGKRRSPVPSGGELPAARWLRLLRRRSLLRLGHRQRGGDGGAVVAYAAVARVELGGAWSVLPLPSPPGH